MSGAGLDLPERPLIKVRFEIDGRVLREVVDSILMIRWDAVGKTHDRAEVEKHLGLIPYYYGVIATASRDAEIRKAKAEGIVDRHVSGNKDTLTFTSNNASAG